MHYSAVYDSITQLVINARDCLVLTGCGGHQCKCFFFKHCIIFKFLQMYLCSRQEPAVYHTVKLPQLRSSQGPLKDSEPCWLSIDIPKWLLCKKKNSLCFVFFYYPHHKLCKRSFRVAIKRKELIASAVELMFQ